MKLVYLSLAFTILSLVFFLMIQLFGKLAKIISIVSTTLAAFLITNLIFSANEVEERWPYQVTYAIIFAIYLFLAIFFRIRTLVKMPVTI